MAIKNWLLTGDAHGRVAERLIHIPETYIPEETAIIILGDAGCNFWLNKTDAKNKKNVCRFGYTVYCVRGNHEARPETLEFMRSMYDENVNGEVWIEDDFPNIRYFKDGGIYEFNGYRILTIGGAYSVDKEYRLLRSGLTEETNNPAKSGWFSDELLTADEMLTIEKSVYGMSFDFVFTHTCPYSWEPRDLFLGFVDQSKVDTSMEIWLDRLKDEIKWGVFCFGHFHADRTERERVEQFYYRIENIDDIWRKWNVGNAD